MSVCVAYFDLCTYMNSGEWRMYLAVCVFLLHKFRSMAGRRDLASVGLLQKTNNMKLSRKI
jgi:hypothetical protein